MQWNIVRRSKRMECVWCNGNPLTLKSFIDFAGKKQLGRLKSRHIHCALSSSLPLSVRQSRFMSRWWGWKVRWVTAETFRGLTTTKNKREAPRLNSLESYVSKFQPAFKLLDEKSCVNSLRNLQCELSRIRFPSKVLRNSSHCKRNEKFRIVNSRLAPAKAH